MGRFKLLLILAAAQVALAIVLPSGRIEDLNGAPSTEDHAVKKRSSESRNKFAAGPEGLVRQTAIGAAKRAAEADVTLTTKHAPATIVSWHTPIVLVVGLTLIAAGNTIVKCKSDVFAVLGFAVCSSMMLVVNKLAITCLPYPGTLLLLQLLSCGVGVRIAGALGLVEVEALRMERVIQFSATPVAFLATLLANIKILEYANVETFIVVRNATPLATSVLDFLFLGRELPNRRSCLMLLIALVGSVGYVETDAGFKVTAYSWAAIWVLIFLFDQVYIKHIISTVQMSSWTRVYYNNILAGAIALVYVLRYEHLPMVLMHGWQVDQRFGLFVVAVSCLLGTAISYFAFRAREALSATGFTVLGNVCKVLTVAVNIGLWDKHASPAGIVSLSVVLVGSALYEQAPLRNQGVQMQKAPTN